MCYGAVVCALLAFALTFVVEGVSILGPSSLTTPSLVKSHGYPVEEHTVTTDDGYILTMHRIPFSAKTGNDGILRPVAFMMHGFLCSSSDWVLNGPEKALAYVLSDNGFDVWMGNVRGNKYSRKHITKKPSHQDFWDFDWHQMATIDVPAMIQYTIEHAGVSAVSYIGHSQGSTTFLVWSSLNGTVKDVIKSAHLMAPVTYWEHSKSPIVRFGSPLFGQPNALVEIIGSTEFLPSTRGMEILGSVACRDTSPVQGLCSNAYFLILGYNSPYFNETMAPEILSSVPAGASINQVLHFLQLYNSKRFCQFDYGFLRNLIEYGSWSPPDYNLGSIDVPTFLYYSDNDLLNAIPDVERLIRELKPSSLKLAYRMPETGFNHGDHLWGKHVKEILYDKMLEDIFMAFTDYL